MDSKTLPDAPRACPPRNDLRGELNAVWSRNHHCYNAYVDGKLVILNDGQPYVEAGDVFMGVPRATAKARKFEGLARMAKDIDEVALRIPRRVFDALVEHERAYGKLSKIPATELCASGADLLRDNSWPFCRDCLMPFENMFNGTAGEGLWVSRIDDGADICGPCWLGDEYAGDHEKMVAHVLRCDLGGDWQAKTARGQILRHPRDAWMAFEAVTLGYWNSGGLFELLRMHSVSLSTAAIVIGTMAAEIVALAREQLEDKAAAKASAEAARRAAWRDEQRVCA